MASSNLPVVMLGAGYAGIRLVNELSRRSGGKVPILLVDRHPVHVIRTELYEIGQLAEKGSNVRKWAIPIDKLVRRRGVSYREGNVESIDLARSTVTVGGDTVPTGHSPWGSAACRRSTEFPARSRSTGSTGYRRPCVWRARSVGPKPILRTSSRDRVRVVVVGGGSTGTEVAAEIATADWRQLSGPTARPPAVTLVCGALPFLAGLSPGLVEHARRLLHDAGVVLDEGRNVTRVDEAEMTLQDGSRLPYDLGVWAAGIEAPSMIRGLPVPHGRGGRLAVEPTLQVPGHPNVFGIGDVVEIRDPRTGVLVPQTAQAAIAEARVAAENLWRLHEGRTPEPFRFRERGMIVSLGRAKASGNVARVTVWGRPAALIRHWSRPITALRRKRAPGCHEAGQNRPGAARASSRWRSTTDDEGARPDRGVRHATSTGHLRSAEAARSRSPANRCSTTSSTYCHPKWTGRFSPRDTRPTSSPGTSASIRCASRCRRSPRRSPSAPGAG